MTWLTTAWRTSLAIVVATFDEQGRLIDANAGFLRLFRPGVAPPIGSHAEQFFVQPDFATLVSSPADEDGIVHLGLLTVGDFVGPHCSLRGRVWHEDGEVRVLAEHDIEELSRLSDLVLELNRNYADSQLQLAHTNHDLKRLNATLTRQKEELEATLGRIKRLEGLLSICMYCKKIRAEDNAWQKLEQYLTENSDAVFSHGLCPECFEQQMKLLD